MIRSARVVTAALYLALLFSFGLANAQNGPASPSITVYKTPT